MRFSKAIILMLVLVEQQANGVKRGCSSTPSTSSPWDTPQANPPNLPWSLDCGHVALNIEGTWNDMKALRASQVLGDSRNMILEYDLIGIYSCNIQGVQPRCFMHANLWTSGTGWSLFRGTGDRNTRWPKKKRIRKKSVNHNPKMYETTSRSICFSGWGSPGNHRGFAGHGPTRAAFKVTICSPSLRKMGCPSALSWQWDGHTCGVVQNEMPPLSFRSAWLW